MNKLKALSSLLLLLAIAWMTSCRSSKDIEYFQDVNEIPDIAYQYDMANYEIKIMPNDNLLILVTAEKPLAAVPYNSVDLTKGYGITTLEWQGYLVDENGDINFPELGKVHLGGLTKSEAITLLQNKISEFITKPLVNIRIMNYRVSIFGEVNRPGTFSVSSEKISVPEALALAGDMTIYGKREDVLICRVENGEKKFIHVDLTSSSVFFSEAYYLQQNDIIYVKPNRSKAMSSSYNPMTGTILSVATLLIAITTLILNQTK
ncbi:polysaccharide biosynthesis/export family protein [Bacteroidales bacterium OttesenSCG-928-M06]|nr:polysaccharide biosynthesis/export family protein [Bacteroidales bacterium OttesenSCG-928-M06]